MLRCPSVTHILSATLVLFKGFILTGMNLHLAGRTGEQEAGSVLSDVRVGGGRLRGAGADAEAHLWNQWTSPTAVTRKGREMHARGSAIF